MPGLTEYSYKLILGPSLFEPIRKRITIEDINTLTLALAKKSKEKKDGDDEPDKMHHTDIKVDVTGADAEVRNPTDCGPLEVAVGTSRRVYRADNIRAKLSGTAECWIGMCYFVKNLAKFLSRFVAY